MLFKGVQKISTVDWPGKIGSAVFTGGCNFRCPYCQNPDLVVNDPNLQSIGEKEVLQFLEGRKKWIDGLCILGGEPTLHVELPEFIAKVKDMGLLVELDTNGTNPKMLKFLTTNKLLDYIAMDIKAPLDKYSKACGVKVNKDDIQLSVDVIRGSGVEYEFRTTAVPGLYSEEDARAIGKWLRGSRAYYVQQFRNEKTLDPEYTEKKPFSAEELERFRDIASEYFDICEVRI
jgi:pyruvate formate lyase activating enzyme